MNFCIYCGTKISANDKFCPQCGKPIFGHPVNTSQKIETDKEAEPPLESVPIHDEQSVWSEKFASEDASIQDCKSESNSSTERKSGISVLAIVMCSIAAVMLIVFVVLMVTRTSERNSAISQTQTTKTSNGKTKTTTEIAIDLAKKWDEIHNSKKAEDFASIYASQVKYYQQTYTPEMIVKSKRDLFAKTPNFLQMISKFEVTNNTDGSVKVHFDKLVQTSAKEARKTYPSYLVVKKIKGNWLIVEESDDVTDANLAKKKVNSSKNTKGQTVKSNKTCFVSGLNRWKLYNLNGGDYIYEDGRRLEVSLFYNQSYLDCVIIDESGHREFTGVLFNEVGWEPMDSEYEDEHISFESGKNEYVIGQHDFDSDGIDELVIAMRCPDQNIVYGFGIIVYRVYDRKMWRFECPYVYGDIRATVINNIIRVPKNHRNFCYEYAFENGDFVDHTDF